MSRDEWPGHASFIATDHDGRDPGDPALIVDVDGFEGPLDLLLELARRQKVDLQRISILALAEQYLAFVETARRVRLELAADYLVMAAWLAYLKSRLLLPRPPSETTEVPADELAGALARRLARLAAIRAAAQALVRRPQLGHEVFVRGMPETSAATGRRGFDATIYDLLDAYARRRQRQAQARVTIEHRVVWSLAEARDVLERLVGDLADWAPLDAFLLRYAVKPQMHRTVRASAFAAVLEMVREGRVELRQECAFSPIEMRCRMPRASVA